METVFHIPEVPSLVLEEGAHTPSPNGPSVPFYQDPAQRIIALGVKYCLQYRVFQVGALLELAESREGCEIEWEEWENRTIIPLLDPGCEKVSVSGCRLFSVHNDEDDPGAYMRVYDFSARGLAKYMSKSDDGTHDSATSPPKLEATFQPGARYLSPTEVMAEIPLDYPENSSIGYDNILFCHVSVAMPCPFGDEVK